MRIACPPPGAIATCKLLTYDRNRNPSGYAVVLVSEGHLASHAGMRFEGEETDMFGHRELGGIGDRIADALKEYSPKYNNGRRIDVVNQRVLQQGSVASRL
jgi:hypothetical protein